MAAILLSSHIAVFWWFGEKTNQFFLKVKVKILNKFNPNSLRGRSQLSTFSRAYKPYTGGGGG